MVYYVTEFQTSGEGQGASLSYSFTDRARAEAKYYQTLSAAVISAVPKHGVAMFNEDIECIKSDLAYRDEYGEYSVFYVMEFQTNGDQGAVIVTAFDNQGSAEDAYYQTMGIARQSAVQKHGVALMTEDMDAMYRAKAYRSAA